MLKSKKAGDQYRNVNLSNLKLLSTTRNRCTGISDRQLRYIDDTIRDIEALNCGDEKDPEPEVQVVDELTEPVAENEPFVEEEQMDSQEEIPIVMSIQYNNYQDVMGAVEGFLKQSHRSYHPDYVPESACKICSTVEITHADKLAQLSAWRKNFMAQLNLKTVAFTD